MQQKSKKISYIISGIFFAFFTILIVLLKTVDIGTLEESGSTIGLFGLNKFFLDAFGQHAVFDTLSDILLYASFAVAATFVIFASVKFIKAKSLKAVDKSLIALVFLYIITIAIYILFELISINKRPHLDAGELKNSFPSSHILFIGVILISALMEINFLSKNKRLNIALDAFGSAVLTLAIISRLLSGMHWFTDVLGALFLSLALTFLFFGISKPHPHQKRI